jgi:glycerol uptake facilitator-like aquaporin
MCLVQLSYLSHELRFSTTLAEGINPAQGVCIEMFITAALVFAVLMLAAEKHKATPFAPVRLLPLHSDVSFDLTFLRLELD